MTLLNRLRRRDRTPAPTERGSAHRVRRWRRAGSIACGALAVGAIAQAVAPAAPATVPVVVAAGPVAAGQVLTADDLRAARVPAELVSWTSPAPDELVGRPVAAPLAAGDPLTAGVLVPDGSEVPAGHELVFLPLLDPPVLTAATPGATVRLIDRASGEAISEAATVRSSVLADPESPDAMGGLWLELTPRESTALARAGAEGSGAQDPVVVTLTRPSSERNGG